MGNVFFDVGISLDGYMAGPNSAPSNPMGDRGPSMHAWVFGQRAFREALKLGGEGATGPDNDILQAVFDRIGANVMGRHMFEEGAVSWPEEAPFHNEVFVLTHEPREAWPRPGGTVFHFVTDGLEGALERARDAAGEKDVRISGGADTIRQYLNAGLIDEFSLRIAPVFLGGGLRLFDGVDTQRLKVEVVEAVHSPQVTHVRYQVKR